MRSVIAQVLGEDPSAAYDANKYAIHAAPVVEAAQPRDSPPRLYGAPQPGGGPPPAQQPAAQEPSRLGCWIVPPDILATTGGHRQLVTDDVVPRVPQQIAAGPPCVGPNTTSAEYGAETFLTPFDRAQGMVATGSLINTYTGEVASTFEDAMPAPDRRPGDVQRERKSAALRLLAAEGNAPTGRRKKEQENPMQAGDAGVSLPAASFRIDADVQQERAERHERDLYFNRNELAPTELMQTRNPFGFDGYSNRLRIQPYMPVTQELDNKSWIPNATILPGTANAQRAALRLRADANPGRAGPAGCATHTEPGQLLSQVRPGNTNRNFDGAGVDFGISTNGLYGASVQAGASALPQQRAQCNREGFGEYGDGTQLCASAESVLGTLRGNGTDCRATAASTEIVGSVASAEAVLPLERGGGGEARPNATPPVRGGVVCAAASNLRQHATQVAPRPGGLDPGPGGAATQATEQTGSAKVSLDASARFTGATQQGGPDAPSLPSASAQRPTAQDSTSARSGAASCTALGGATLASATGHARATRDEGAPRQRPGDELPRAGGALSQSAQAASWKRQAHGTRGARQDSGIGASTAMAARREAAKPEWLQRTAERAESSGTSGASVPASWVLSSPGPSVESRPATYGQAAPGSRVSSAQATLSWSASETLGDAPKRRVAQVNWEAQAAHGAEGRRAEEELIDSRRPRAGLDHARQGPALIGTQERRLEQAWSAETSRGAGGGAGAAAALGAEGRAKSERGCASAGERPDASADGAGGVRTTSLELPTEGRFTSERHSASPGEGAAASASVAVASLKAPRAPTTEKTVADCTYGAAAASTGEVTLSAQELHCEEEQSWRGGACELARRKDPSAFFVRDLRGLQEIFRPVVALVGGDVQEDPFRRFAPGVREWRPEILITPNFERSDLGLEERSSLGRMHTPHRRELRVVRSPKPSVRARCGIAQSLGAELSSRCEEVAD